MAETKEMVEMKEKVEEFLKAPFPRHFDYKGRFPDYFNYIYDALVEIDERNPDFFIASLLYRNGSGTPDHSLVACKFEQTVAEIVHCDEHVKMPEPSEYEEGSGEQDEYDQFYAYQFDLLVGNLIARIVNVAARIKCAMNNGKKISDLSDCLCDNHHLRTSSEIGDSDVMEKYWAYLDKLVEQAEQVLEKAEEDYMKGSKAEEEKVKERMSDIKEMVETFMQGNIAECFEYTYDVLVELKEMNHEIFAAALISHLQNDPGVSPYPPENVPTFPSVSQEFGEIVAEMVFCDNYFKMPKVKDKSGIDGMLPEEQEALAEFVTKQLYILIGSQIIKIVNKASRIKFIMDHGEVEELPNHLWDYHRFRTSFERVKKEGSNALDKYWEYLDEMVDQVLLYEGCYGRNAMIKRVCAKCGAIYHGAAPSREREVVLCDPCFKKILSMENKYK